MLYNLRILFNSLADCLPAFAWLIRHEPDPVLRTRVYGTQVIWIASGLWAGLGIRHLPDWVLARLSPPERRPHTAMSDPG
jgi:hypothetical protein